MSLTASPGLSSAGDADDFSAPENVVIQPTADATLKFACFVGDKPYTQEFLDTIGL